MKSPLLFPVKLENDKIIVLDETQLPFKEVYLKVEELDAALDILERMKTRSLGQVLLFFYCAALFKEKVSIDQLVEKFKAKIPTFDFLMLGVIVKAGVDPIGWLDRPIACPVVEQP